MSIVEAIIFTVLGTMVCMLIGKGLSVLTVKIKEWKK